MRATVVELDGTLAPGRWTVDVVVRVRCPLRHFYKNGKMGTVQTTVAHDGHRDVAIVCFNEEVERFAAAPPGWIRISGAEIKSPAPGYQLTEHPWEIMFGRESEVGAVAGNVPPPPVPRLHHLRDLTQPTARANVVATVVSVGPQRPRAFCSGVLVDAVLSQDGVEVAVRLEWVEGMGGRTMLFRDLRVSAVHDGWLVTATGTTSLHGTIHPVQPTRPWVGPGAIPLDEVAGVGRAGPARCQVQAVLTWHSAVGGYDRPDRWTEGRRSDSARIKPQLQCRLVDSTASLDAKAFGTAATLILGHTLGELLHMDAEDFDNSCAAALFRPLEWTLDVRPSDVDNTVYVNIVDAVHVVGRPTDWRED
jgi:hypothetical protein